MVQQGHSWLRREDLFGGKRIGGKRNGKIQALEGFGHQAETAAAAPGLGGIGVGGGAHGPPGVIVGSELQDGPNPLIRTVGDDHFLSIPQAGGFRRQGAEHLGEAMGGGGHHLALDAGAGAQRGHEEAMRA